MKTNEERIARPGQFLVVFPASRKDVSVGYPAASLSLLTPGVTDSGAAPFKVSEISGLEPRAMSDGRVAIKIPIRYSGFDRFP